MPLLDDQELITGDSSLMNPLQSILGALSDETFRSTVFGDPEQWQVQDLVPGLSTAREAVVAANRFKEAKEARSTIGAILRNTEGAGHALLAASDFATPGIPLVGLAGTFGSTLFKSFEKVAPKLDSAIERLMKGESPETVRKETGFFIAGDGLPRYEFSDATAKVNLDRIPKNSAARVDIKDLISHDILYDEYPDMANIQVKMETDPRNSGSFQARFDHEGKLIGGTIWVDPKSNEEQLTSTLLHEIQHWIQVKERIAEGSSTDLFEGFKSSLPHALETRRDFENALEFSNWLRKNPEKFKDNFQRVLNEYDSVSSAPMNLQVAKAFHNGDISIKDINGFINTLNSDIDMTQNLIKTPSGFNYYRTMGEIEARDVSRRWRDIARGNLTESETFEYPPVLNMRAEHAVVDPNDPNKLTRSGALREIPKEDQLVIRRSDFSRKRGKTVASDVNYGKNF